MPLLLSLCKHGTKLYPQRPRTVHNGASCPVAVVIAAVVVAVPVALVVVVVVVVVCFSYYCLSLFLLLLVVFLCCYCLLLLLTRLEGTPNIDAMIQSAVIDHERRLD